MVLFGGEILNWFLYFIWLCDCFGFMLINGKIEVLNIVIWEFFFEMKWVVDENFNVNVLVWVVKFFDGV